eukprot:318580_1
MAEHEFMMKCTLIKRPSEAIQMGKWVKHHFIQKSHPNEGHYIDEFNVTQILCGIRTTQSLLHNTQRTGDKHNCKARHTVVNVHIIQKQKHQQYVLSWTYGSSTTKRDNHSIELKRAFIIRSSAIRR